MDYLDNPRKVYGRVDIVYSDSQISDDIATATNSKAEISHTEEVFKGYLSPTAMFYYFAFLHFLITNMRTFIFQFMQFISGNFKLEYD